MLYNDKDLPEGAILHLLNVDEKKRALFHMVLYRYWDLFPSTLPTWALPNQKLGDVHAIPLIEGVELVRKSMYRYSP